MSEVSRKKMVQELLTIIVNRNGQKVIHIQMGVKDENPSYRLVILIQDKVNKKYQFELETMTHYFQITEKNLNSNEELEKLCTTLLYYWREPYKNVAYQYSTF